ncbi:MAG: class I SAM-dependent methyltransferase [Promethearchaeota archaeon]
MNVFEELALIYDQSINWAQRLQRELPLLRGLIQEKKIARILDLACGSGRHAVALAKDGHEVIGLDLSSQMISAAQTYAQENDVQVQFHVANMENANTIVKDPFDVILCLGNSLALLPSLESLQQTLKGVQQMLSQDGYFVSQILNFEEIRHSQFRFFPLKYGRTPGGDEVIFVRFFEPLTSSSIAHLVFTGLIKHGNTWETQTHSQQVLQLSQHIMEEQFLSLNFTRVELFSSYSRQPFSALESRNLITLAQR